MSRTWSLPNSSERSGRIAGRPAHRPRKSVVAGGGPPRAWSVPLWAGSTGLRREIDELPVYWERPDPPEAAGTVTLTDATRTLLRGVSDLAGRAGELRAPETGKWYPADSASATTNRHGMRAAGTVGWPHHGSTVLRVVHCRCSDVVATIRSQQRWERLTMERWIDPAQAFDVVLSARGRLRIPWTAVPVPVLLRVTPFLGERTLLELMVTAHFRFPRRFWAVGHEAIGAMARRSRLAAG